MRIFGLVGKSLDHSWSRKYFEEKFRREQIPDCHFENFPMDDVSEVRSLIVRKEAIAGLNVTLPFKTAVVSLMDSLSPDAEAVQAVNCVRIHRTGNSITLEGLNTDAPAFLQTLMPLLTKEIKKALVLGTGGASRAVCHALDAMQIEYSRVSRTAGKGNYTYQDLTPGIICKHPLIINATPLGMKGFEGHPPPIPYEALGRNHILYDLVYNPPETIFLKRGKMAGAIVVNGLEMLRIQAELSWTAWNP